MATKGSSDVVHFCSPVNERDCRESEALLFPVLRIPDTRADDLLYKKLREMVASKVRLAFKPNERTAGAAHLRILAMDGNGAFLRGVRHRKFQRSQSQVSLWETRIQDASLARLALRGP